MRIPGTKIWRAFPELDRFSDAECAIFVDRARREFGGSKSGWMALTSIGVALATPVAIVLARVFWQTVIEVWIEGRWGGPAARDAAMPVGFGAFWLYILMVCLTYLVVRDRWLIRTITKRIQMAACVECGYSLLGLVAVGGVVTCPECNRGLFLADAGLTQDDLMAKSDSR